ncbi:MAG: MarR family transcriptional regulator [Clostridia bacterium]|nr:MarR family transcriptional regulator [Clostridia bacterium]
MSAPPRQPSQPPSAVSTCVEEAERHSLCGLTGRLERAHLLRGLHLKKTMPQHGLYFGQLPLLRYIARHDGCTGAEAAAALHVSTASVAVSTGRLQKAGLLLKQEDAQDRRIKRLHITEEGLRRATLCHRAFEELDRLAYEGLSPEEIATLSALLDRISANLARALGDGRDLSTAPLHQLLEELGPPPRPPHGGR